MGRGRLKHGASTVKFMPSRPSARVGPTSLSPLSLWHDMVVVTFHLRASNNVGCWPAPAIWRRQYRLSCSAKKLAYGMVAAVAVAVVAVAAVVVVVIVPTLVVVMLMVAVVVVAVDLEGTEGIW